MVMPNDIFSNSKMDKAFIIAEAEINHNGDLQTALKMVKVASEVGADAIKFQYIVAEEIAAPGSVYYDLFKSVELSQEAFRQILCRAKELSIVCFLTVPSIESLPRVLEIEPPMIKIGSTNLTNIPLLETIGKTGLPVILSTGLGTLGEIDRAILALNASPARIALLHCTVKYPAPLPSLNLRAIETLRFAFSGHRIGFSDHTEGESAAIAALALGARIFEKHFTLDKAQKGPDHAFSTDPDGFARYVAAIRQIEQALGDGIKRPHEAEIPMIRTGRRYIVAARKISKGSNLREDDLSCRRIPADKEGVEPAMLHRIVGWRAPKNYAIGEPLSWNDFKEC